MYVMVSAKYLRDYKVIVIYNTCSYNKADAWLTK